MSALPAHVPSAKEINMTIKKNWAVSTKRSVIVDVLADTSASIYRAHAYKPFRKFTTRSEARAFKASLKNPTHYCIINTATSNVVR